MSYLVSDKLFQVTLIRSYLRLMLVGFVISSHPAHASPQGEGNLPELNLFSFQISSSHDSSKASNDYIGLGIPSSTLNSSTHESRLNSIFFGDTFRLPTLENTNMDSIWAASIRWHLVSSSDRASLAPVFRVESEGNRFELRPIQRSARIMWSMQLP